MPNFDLPPSPNVDAGSPRIHPIPLSYSIKRTCNGNNMSAAEREALDAAKARLVSLLHFRSIEDIIVFLHQILPRSARPSPHQRAAMMRDALEKKKAAVLLLASAQRDLETQSSFMIEETSLQETIRLYDTHYNIGDHQTATGRFIKAVSSITYKSRSAEGPVSCPVLLLASLPHHLIPACVRCLIIPA